MDILLLLLHIIYIKYVDKFKVVILISTHTESKCTKYYKRKKRSHYLSIKTMNKKLLVQPMQYLLNVNVSAMSIISVPAQINFFK